MRTSCVTLTRSFRAVWWSCATRARAGHARLRACVGFGSTARAHDVVRLPSSRLDRSMLELLDHPAVSVMRRATCKLRAAGAAARCWALLLRAAREREKRVPGCGFKRWNGAVGCRNELRDGSEEWAVRGAAGGVGKGSRRENSSAIFGRCSAS